MPTCNRFYQTSIAIVNAAYVGYLVAVTSDSRTSKFWRTVLGDPAEGTFSLQTFYFRLRIVSDCCCDRSPRCRYGNVKLLCNIHHRDSRLKRSSTARFDILFCRALPCFSGGVHIVCAAVGVVFAVKLMSARTITSNSEIELRNTKQVYTRWKQTRIESTYAADLKKPCVRFL